jgi:hypothetical protein
MIDNAHRWYDRDPHLSELVRTLETFSLESQTLFASLLADFSDDIHHAKGGQFFRELNWGKLVDIFKSRDGRRWYDQQPEMHKAFNKLYSLADEDKAHVARQLTEAVRLVKQYELECQAHQQKTDVNALYTIVETAFQSDATVLEHLLKARQRTQQ